jgi:hypothetical protein
MSISRERDQCGPVLVTMLALALAWLVGCGGAVSSGGPAADAAFDAADAGDMAETPDDTTAGDAGDAGGERTDASTDAAPLLDAGGEGGPLSCAQISLLAASRLTTAFETAQDLSCQIDGDCMVAWTFSDCTFTCWSVANQRGAAAIAAAIDSVNRDVCPAFKAAGCPAIRPPCVPPLPLACIAGACTIRYR